MIRKFFSVSSYQENKVAYLVLNNTEKRNPLNFSTLTQINYYLDMYKENFQEKQYPRVLVIKRNVFSSGLDLNEIYKNDHIQNDKLFTLMGEISCKINKMPYVSICQLKGLCAATGLQLALSCDLVIADQNTQISLPSLKVGLFSFTPAIQLQQTISQRKIIEMILTSQKMNAQQALDYGIINQICNQKELDEVTQDYIFKILSSSADIIAYGKKNLYRIMECQTQSEKYVMATETLKKNIQRKDGQIGIQSFINKENPKWQNKN